MGGLGGFGGLGGAATAAGGLGGQHRLGFGFGDGFGIAILGNFDVVEASRAFDIGAVGAVNDHEVAKVGDNGIKLGLVETLGGGKVNGIGVVIFDGEVVFAGFEVGTEGTSGGNERGAVGGGTEQARQGGEGELGESLFKGDGINVGAIGERGETRLFAGGFFVVAELDETAVFADFGVDGEFGLGVGAEGAGVVVARGGVGLLDFLLERTIEIAEHLDAFKLVVGDLVQVFFNVGGELIVNDVGEVLSEEAGDKLANGGGDELAFVGAGFFGGSSLVDLTVREGELNDGAGLAFGGALLDVAAGLNGGENGGIGGGAADAEFFKFFDQRTFGVAGGWFGEGLASGDFDGGELVAGGEGGELFVLGATSDFEEAIKDNDFAFGFKEVFRDGGGGDFDGGFLGDGVGHLGGKGALADELVELALVIVFAGGDALNLGGADGLVGFLGGGGFGGKAADFEVFLAIFGSDVVGDGGDGLFREIETVGAVVGNEASLVESLGGVHGGAGGEAEAGVGFNLE